VRWRPAGEAGSRCRENTRPATEREKGCDEKKKTLKYCNKEKKKRRGKKDGRKETKREREREREREIRRNRESKTGTYTKREILTP
jgi:hypothetical protein